VEGRLSRRLDPQSDRPTTSSSPRRAARALADGEQVSIRLEGAVQHSYDITRPDRYETRRYERLRMVLRDRFASEERVKMFERKSARSMTWSEAGAAAVDPTTTPQARASARVSGTSSSPSRSPAWSSPARAALASTTVAAASRRLRLLHRHRRRLLVLLSQGEKAAIAGEVSPATAMWLPNLLLGGVGLLMLLAKNRDRSLLPARLRARLRIAPSWSRAWGAVAARLPSGRRRARAESGRAGALPDVPATPRRAAARRVVLRLPRLRLRFPNLIDRYVLRMFFFVFLLVLASGVSLLIVTDFTENVDEMMKHRPPARDRSLLQVPIAAARLRHRADRRARHHPGDLLADVAIERGDGLPGARHQPLPDGASRLRRRRRHRRLFALLQAEVLPASNLKVAEARAVIKGQPLQRFARSADRQWQMGRGRFMYNFLHFDEKNSALQRLQVSSSIRMAIGGAPLRRGGAFRRAGLDPGARMDADLRRPRATRLPTLPRAVEVDLEEPPAFFAEEPRRPDEMTYAS